MTLGIFQNIYENNLSVIYIELAYLTRTRPTPGADPEVFKEDADDGDSHNCTEERPRVWSTQNRLHSKTVG